VLIEPVAAATERIRVGSGGVMLPHYSPYEVAESFSLLAGCIRAGSTSGLCGAGPAWRWDELRACTEWVRIASARSMAS
jgi:hypothetical protein